jgi:hypothetical protein
MWNAVIKDKNYKDHWVMPTRMPAKRSDAAHNSDLAATLWVDNSTDLGLKTLGGTFKNGKKLNLLANVRECSLNDFEAFLTGFKWIDNRPPTDFHLMQDFLSNSEHRITSCLLIAPQLQNPRPGPDLWEGLTVEERTRSVGTGTFHSFDDKNHRAIAEYLTGRSSREKLPHSLSAATPDTGGLVSDSRMICLFYPVRAKKPNGGHEDFITIGFSILFPNNNLPAGLTYSTRVKNNNPVVNVDEVEDNDANPVGSA